MRIAEPRGIHLRPLRIRTLRKSTLWESTAIPEFRQQAQTVARTALADLSGREAFLHSSRLQPDANELESIFGTRCEISISAACWFQKES
jgi:hypothetical protein